MEHRSIDTNGIRLHAVTAGDPDRPLSLLLHGFPELWYAWRRYLPILAEAGLFAVAPDQRGFNLSDKPRPVSAYALDVLADDVIGMMDALGKKTAALAGHDWGAAVAWWTAMRHPDRVSRLAVINVPHPLVMRSFLFTHPSQMAKSWYMFFFQLPLLPELAFSRSEGRAVYRRVVKTARPGAFRPEDEAVYLEAWRQPGAVRAMLNWYRAAFRELLPPAIRSPEIKPDTLIVWGKQDELLDVRLAEASTQLCRSVRTEYFDQATHWVHHEEVDAVSRLLVEHLRIV